MVHFRVEKVSKRVTRIFGINTELMYLVEGEDKAALLDTGSGFGSLKETVEGLTEKPVTVLLTHGHTDHAMGAGEFDVVYMNHEDDYIYGPHGDKAFRWDGMQMSADYEMLEEDDYIPTGPAARFCNMKDGDRFELGGAAVEIHALPGHTKGSMAMRITEEEGECMMLLGDACNDLTFLFQDYSLSVEEYEENLRIFQSKTKGMYDRVLLSHGAGEGPVNMVECVIAVCAEIRAGEDDAVPFEFRGDKGFMAKKEISDGVGRMDGGRGNVVYCRERICKKQS